MQLSQILRRFARMLVRDNIFLKQMINRLGRESIYPEKGKKSPELRCARHLELFRGCLISVGQRLLFRYPQTFFPQSRISEYRLVKPVIKYNQPTNFSMGIYATDGRRFFIKTWTGKLKNMEYYTLVNEFLLTSFIKGKLETLPKRLKLKVATPVEYISSEGSLSIVYEYISGPALSEVPLSQQCQVSTRTLQDLKTLTKSLTTAQMNYLPQRTKLEYLLALPVHLLISTLHDFRLLPHLLNETVQVLRLYPKMKYGPLTLAHRDLIPENIIMHQGNPYLIDCGSFVLTHPAYDLSYLAVRPLSVELYNSISRQTSLYAHKFFKSYINVQFAQAHQFERTNCFKTREDFKYAKT